MRVRFVNTYEFRSKTVKISTLCVYMSYQEVGTDIKTLNVKHKIPRLLVMLYFTFYFI